MIRDARFHSFLHAERLMQTAEFVVHRVWAHHRHCGLLANGQRSPAAVQDGTRRRLVQRVLGLMISQVTEPSVFSAFRQQADAENRI